MRKIIKKYINSFLLMIQLLTRIPINKALPCEKEDFRRGIYFFPIVGLILGAIQFVVFYLSSKVFSNNISAVFTVFIGFIITGGLHLDGFCDTCDGFFASKGKDKIVEIMKDSRIGTFGALGAMFIVLLKIYTTSSLNLEMMQYIIIVPIISRSIMTILFAFGKNAKKTGSGNLFIENCNKLQLIIVFLLCICLSIIFVDLKKLIILIISNIILVVLFNLLCIKKINGITGDSLGASNELSEVLTLLILTINKF